MSTLKEQLQADLTAAIRAQDSVVSGTLRMALAAITNEEVAGKAAKTLTDAETVTVLTREGKKRREAIEAYVAANRQDLADKEAAELAVLEQYLPEQLGADELAQMIADAVAEAKAGGADALAQAAKCHLARVGSHALTDGNVIDPGLQLILELGAVLIADRLVDRLRAHQFVGIDQPLMPCKVMDDIVHATVKA